MKKIKKRKREPLKLGETGLIRGGNLWPFFDIEKLISQIMLDEDIFFKDLYKD